MQYVIIALAILIVIGIIYTNSAYKLFVNAYNKFNQIITNQSKTTIELLVLFIQNSGFNIKYCISDNENDNYYSSSNNVIVLSKEICDSNSLASIAIMAHEFGHSIQKNSKNLCYIFSSFLKKLSYAFGWITLPLIIIGIIQIIFANVPTINLFLIIGVALLFISLFSQLIIISVEKNASQIGLQYLKQYDILDKNDFILAKKFLRKALGTYKASFLSKLLAWTFLVPKYKD